MCVKYRLYLTDSEMYVHELQMLVQPCKHINKTFIFHIKKISWINNDRVSSATHSTAIYYTRLVTVLILNASLPLRKL